MMKLEHSGRRNSSAIRAKATLGKYRQKGAVMIVALMLLLVMTVLAVSGIGNSILEQKMSGNFYDSGSAFEAAEYGVRVAEQWLFDNKPSTTLFTSTSGTGLYTARNLSTSNSNEVCGGSVDCAFDPNDESQWCSGSTAGCKLPKGFLTLGDSIDGKTLDPVDMNLSRPPQLIIEYIGEIYNPGSDPIMLGGKHTPPPDFAGYRITVIGWGLDGTSRHALESHVKLPL